MAVRIKFRKFVECDTEAELDVSLGDLETLFYSIDTDKYWKTDGVYFYEVIPDDVVFNSPIPISKLDISGVPSGSQFLRDDGAWAVPAGGGASVFTDLTDVPASYSGSSLKAVRVNSGETGLEFYTPSTVTSFISLSDVPSSYVGKSLELVRVNAGETGLEFFTPTYLTTISGITAGGDLSGTYANPTVAKFNGQLPSFYLLTTNITEGTNLYYTASRFNTAFAAKSTSDLTEGSNLYFTNARAIASTLTGYTSGAGTISSSDTILGAIQKLNGNIGALVTGVSSVSGTANRITSTGGATPVIDISATFEALLGKVASPLSQFAATTSSQLAGVISDETGSGVLVFNASPAFTGTLTYGTLSYSDTDIAFSFQKSVNSYFQTIWQNTNSGATASTDIVISSDNGTATTHYVNVGKNSSGFTGTGALNQAGYGYFTSTSDDLVIGTTTANGIHFVVNNGATDALSISSAGDVTTTTQSANDNSTKVATTAYVDSSVLYGNLPPTTFDGQGAVVLVNSIRYFRAKKAGTISAWSIIAEGTSPTCTIDIFKIATGTVLPTSSITAAALPALSTGNALKSTTLTGWTTSYAADDMFAIKITACSAATKIVFDIYS